MTEDQALNRICDQRLSERRYPIEKLFKRYPATPAPIVTGNVIRIVRPDRAFHFRKPIGLSVKRSGPLTVIGYAPIELEGFGNNELEALESFGDQFAGMWDWIAGAADGELTPGARKLKRRLKSMVRVIE